MKKELFSLLQPEVEALGFELWGVVYLPQGKHALLRVYIEHASGITVDDCEKVSRQVSALLDVENLMSGHYTLEVSSPGVDRPLFYLAQYPRFIGSQIAVRLHIPIGNRRKFQGELKAVNQEVIQVMVEGAVIEIPFNQIERANVLPSI